MSFRPVPARWMEVLVPRTDCTMALELMAKMGAVELEARVPGQPVASAPECRAGLDEFLDLARRYGAYWPRASYHPAPLPASPRETIVRALARIRAWEREALPVIHRLQRLENERAELRLWRDLLSALRDSALDFQRLAEAGPVLAVHVALLPGDAELELLHGVLVRRCALGEQQCLLLVGPTAQVESIKQRVIPLKGRCISLPVWLQPKAEDNLYAVALRLVNLNGEIAALEAALRRLGSRHGLAKAVGDVRRIEWLSTQVGALPGSDHFMLVTGWTDDLNGARLTGALRHARLRFLLSFPPAPAGASPPLLLSNPWWARPFEVFSRALGMPGIHEADPSLLLAFVAPLLFGYMFGDLGQGLVLLAAGYGLRRHGAIARLLMAGGVMSAVFGLLFGSVFGREDWIPALWLHTLEDPLTVLVLPLLAGVALLGLGMALRGIEAHWRGTADEWWAMDAGMVLLYIGLLATLFEPAGALLALFGAAWYVSSHARHRKSIASVLAAVASAADEAVRLVINTVSFARVGAFALAHAGLSAAMVSLADAAPGLALRALVMVAGNAVVLGLEGLVVSVQTTRLILLEFFMRFLSGEGRVFRPLHAPDSVGGELNEPVP